MVTSTAVMLERGREADLAGSTGSCNKLNETRRTRSVQFLACASNKVVFEESFCRSDVFQTRPPEVLSYWVGYSLLGGEKK